MCKDTMYNKTSQELEALKNAKMVIAKVLEEYALQKVRKNSESATKHENNTDRLTELIGKCSAQVTEEVAAGHFTYDMAIHVMCAIGLILSGRTVEFRIVDQTSWNSMNTSETNKVREETKNEKTDSTL